MASLSPFERLQSLFFEALDLPEDEREAFVNAVDDASMRAQLAAMLVADTEDDALLDGALTGGLASMLAAADDDDPMEGRVVGPYRIEARVGEGGMGVVYRARRTDVGKEVALKLMRSPLVPSETLQRFAREQRVLARLHHPNIAQLLDAGMADDLAPGTDVPYIAMEYVPGAPLTTYCDTHRLSVEARVRLFLQVADAVQFAHTHLVVHRDLKPSNVLVEDRSTGAPQVKLLDFGIAKLLASEGEATLTRTGAWMLTPAYAAPEQIRGEAVTAATDVYALGVLLYELLAGRLPHDIPSVLTPQAMETVLTTDPPQPSAASTTDTGPPARSTSAESPSDRPSAETAPAETAPGGTTHAAAVADGRDTTPARLRRTLQGDLDVIVMKALRKEPERRYASVEALRDDLQRYLNREPVRARPDTLTYRVQKFTSRNQGLVAATAAVMLALLLGIGAALWQAREAAEARRVAEAALKEAERELVQSKAALTFLEDLFLNATPDYSPTEEPTARDLLDRGAERLNEVEQPDVRARLMSVIGTTYRFLGALPTADSLQTAAVALRRARVADDSSTALRRGLALDLEALGETRFDQGRYADAAARFEEAYASLTSISEAAVSDQRSLAQNLMRAYSKMGRLHRAADLGREDLRLLRSEVEQGQADSLSLAVGVNNLSVTLQRLGQHGDGVTLAREAVAILDAMYGDEPQISRSFVITNLALALVGAARPEEAVPLARQALEMRTTLLDPPHPLEAIAHHNLAEVLFYAGQMDEAVTTSRAAQARMIAVHGPSHPGVADVLHTYGQLLRVTQRPDSARLVLDRTVTLRREVLGDDHLRVAKSLTARAQVLLDQDRPAAAEADLREAADIVDRAFSAPHPFRAVIDLYLGEALLRQSRRNEAVSLLTSAYDRLDAASGQERIKAPLAARLLVQAEADGSGSSAARAEWEARTRRPDSVHVALPLDVID